MSRRQVLVPLLLGVLVSGACSSVAGAPTAPSTPSTGPAPSSTALSSTALSSTGPTSTGPSSSVPFEAALVLDVDHPTSVGSSEVGAAVSAVIGGVPDLPASAREGDLYVGTLDGRTRINLALTGATDTQVAEVGATLAGTHRFALRLVRKSTLDRETCAKLTAAPEADRQCDTGSGEVLTLGESLGIRPTTVRASSSDGLPVVVIGFARSQATTLASYTAAHVGDRLAFSDGRTVVSAPTINQRIVEGRVQLAGSFTSATVKATAGSLQLAAWGVSITVVRS